MPLNDQHQSLSLTAKSTKSAENQTPLLRSFFFVIYAFFAVNMNFI